MKVVTVCGMGFGTSLMLLMSVKESGRKYGITVREFHPHALRVCHKERAPRPQARSRHT